MYYAVKLHFELSPLYIYKKKNAQRLQVQDVNYRFLAPITSRHLYN